MNYPQRKEVRPIQGNLEKYSRMIVAGWAIVVC